MHGENNVIWYIKPAIQCGIISLNFYKIIRFIEKTNLAVKDWITSVYKIKRIKYKIQLD
jgi:hypothetical protein